MDETDLGARLHADLHGAVAALRAIEIEEQEEPVGPETVRAANEALERARETVSNLDESLDSSETRDATFFVLLTIREHQARLRDAAVTRGTLVDALSTTESALMQLRELASKQFGRRTVHGPSELARATKCRASVARLLMLARYGSHDNSLAQRARLVGTGMANLLAAGGQTLLSIQARHLLKGLRSRIHRQLTDLAEGRPCPDEELIRTLSDACGTLELLRAHANIELREHDLAGLRGAREFFNGGDRRSALFVLRGLRGLHERLDRTLEVEEPLENELMDILDELDTVLVPSSTGTRSLDSMFPIGTSSSSE